MGTIHRAAVSISERECKLGRGLAGGPGNCYFESSMASARSVGLALERVFPPISDEAALVAELRAGSEQAFAYLLRIYQNPIFNLVSHLVEPGTEPADVLQDVFVKVFNGIRHFHGVSSLRTWIYRIAVHEASNHRRSWLRRHRRGTVSFADKRAPPGAKKTAKPPPRHARFCGFRARQRPAVLATTTGPICAPLP